MNMNEFNVFVNKNKDTGPYLLGPDRIWTMGLKWDWDACFLPQLSYMVPYHGEL